MVVVCIFMIFPTKTTWIHNSQTHFCSFAFPFVGWSEIYRGITIRVTFLCGPSPKSVTNRRFLQPHCWRGWIILSSLVLSSKLSSFSTRVMVRCQSPSQTDCQRRERRKLWFTLELVPLWLFYSALELWWGKLSEVVQTNQHQTTQPNNHPKNQMITWSRSSPSSRSPSWSGLRLTRAGSSSRGSGQGTSSQHYKLLLRSGCHLHRAVVLYLFVITTIALLCFFVIKITISSYY